LGHFEVVKLLLDAGADIEAVMPLCGSTSLYIASQKGHSEVVKILLDAGADKEATAS
jgi:ankyrin repeat protein